MNVHHSTNIHTSAIVEKGAIIGKNCTVGPFCYLGSEVVLSENTTLISHVSITGDTLIGENTKIWPFASIGHDPQDLKFSGEKTKLIIGQNNKRLINPNDEKIKIIYSSSNFFKTKLTAPPPMSISKLRFM